MRVDCTHGTWDVLAAVKASDLSEPLRTTMVSALVRAEGHEVVCRLLVDHALDNASIREVLFRSLCSDMRGRWRQCDTTLVEELLGLVRVAPYGPARSAAYALTNLFDVLPMGLRRCFLVELLGDDRIVMRRRAYKHLRAWWRADIAGLVRRAWTQFVDRECAQLIILRFDRDFLLHHREQLAHAVTGTKWLSSLYVKLGEVAPDVVEELRELDGVAYTYVHASLGGVLEEDDAWLLFRENWRDQRVGLLLWSLGVMGHSDVVLAATAFLELTDLWRSGRPLAETGVSLVDWLGLRIADLL